MNKEAYVIASENSARECGCDKGANWVCEHHRQQNQASHPIFSSSVPESKGAFTLDMANQAIKETHVGIGGAPTRPFTLPEEAKDRKRFPIATGLLDYFPDALVAVAHLSYRGNNQHNPGKPLHWDRSKSADEADTIMRHFMQRGTLDKDGVRHSVKVAWRALALLQKEIESEMAAQSNGV